MIVPTELLIRLEDAWGVRPVMTLACVGGSDEHLQVWHPADRGMPVYVMDERGNIEAHPDADPQWL